MKEIATFFVPGTPRPAGSKNAFPYRCKTTGKIKVRVVDASGKAGKQWRRDIAAHAKVAYRGPLLTCPIIVNFVFFMPRPKAHLRTGRFSGQRKSNAPRYHTSKPDALKLARAVEDALTGIVWADDAQIILEDITKQYQRFPVRGDYDRKPGVHVKIWAEMPPVFEGKESRERGRR